MPPLNQYTASGQIRQGPVAPTVDASELNAGARALGNVGNAIANAGQDVAVLLEKRQQETDNRWVGESVSSLDRDLVDWRVANQEREDYGQAFKAYADERLAEIEKNAPSGKAAQSLRRSALPGIDAAYAKTSFAGEENRLNNYDKAEIQNDINRRGAYLAGSQLDQDFANDLILSDMAKSSARIEATIGDTMPLRAAAMIQRTEIATVLAATDSDPIFARKILESSKHIEAGKYEQLSAHIEQAARNMESTALFNVGNQIDAQIADGLETLKPVKMPSPQVLSLFPKEHQARIKFDVDTANGTIAKFSEVKGWNWQEQQKSIAAIPVTNDPVNRKVRENLIKLTKESQKQQTEDPLGWQSKNDPEFIAATGRVLAAPADQQPALMTDAIKRMVSLQGPAPVGTPEDQQKRYLGLDTGLQRATTTAQAEANASHLNNTTPNQLTQAVEGYDAKYPDEKVRAMVWNDMQNLPEGKKLKMGIRVGAAIENIYVRNNFLGAMSNKNPIKTEESKSKFDTATSSDPMYSRFVAGWKGDGNQRGSEMADFTEAVTKYAMQISVDDKINDPSKAVAKSVQRIVTDNYGMMTINGTDVPIHRSPSARVHYGDADVANIQTGIQRVINTLDVDSISLTESNFPLAPRLPGSKAEDNAYLSRAIRSTGTVVPEPGGTTATVYVKGLGLNDFPFQLRQKNGLPFVIDFEDAALLGSALNMRTSGTPEQRAIATQSDYDASLKRQGLSEKDMQTLKKKIRIDPFAPKP